VWFYSVVGFFIYLVLFVVLALLVTVLVLAYGRWGPRIGNSTRHELLFGDAGRQITYTFEQSLLKLTVESVVSYGLAIVVTRLLLIDRWKPTGYSVTRNHSLYFLYVSWKIEIYLLLRYCAWTLLY
jgi:hypothetical protein